MWAIGARYGHILEVGEGRSRVGFGVETEYYRGTDVKLGELHFPVRNAPAPDIVHDHFPGFVEHPVNDPVFPATRIRYSDSAPASLIASCGSGFAKKIFHVLKNIREQVFWDFPAIFLHAVL